MCVIVCVVIYIYSVGVYLCMYVRKCIHIHDTHTHMIIIAGTIKQHRTSNARERSPAHRGPSFPAVAAIVTSTEE